MNRNILELKSIRIAPEKVTTPESARRVRRLKDFDLKEEYFDTVYHPADLVEEFYQLVQGSGFKVQGSDFVQKVQKVQEIELSPNGPNVALNIPVGQWHTVRALESGTVILEAKDGAYEPLSDADILSL